MASSSFARTRFRNESSLMVGSMNRSIRGSNRPAASCRSNRATTSRQPSRPRSGYFSTSVRSTSASAVSTRRQSGGPVSTSGATVRGSVKAKACRCRWTRFTTAGMDSRSASIQPAESRMERLPTSATTTATGTRFGTPARRDSRTVGQSRWLSRSARCAMPQVRRPGASMFAGRCNGKMRCRISIRCR